jgi:iron complex outermembrane recepter protein
MYRRQCVNNMRLKYFFRSFIVMFVTSSFAASSMATNNAPLPDHLEEIVVTAQKRKQTLHEIPMALSVLNENMLRLQGVSSLGDLASSTITSLNIQPYANSPSTLVVSIRGNGPGDVGQTTRDSSVAIYIDEIYLGRSQALDFELAEVERIEILRGPQGTLYGRNATSGAINLISRQPTGELGLRQTFSVGRYNQKTSVTHLDLPEKSGLRTKIDTIYSERDGWVENDAPGQADYNEYIKSGGRFTGTWQASETLDLDYSYIRSKTKMSQNYYQFFRDFLFVFGDEGGRQEDSRLPLALKPSTTDQSLHNLTVDWVLSDDIQFKSISSYRELDSEDQNNFGGVYYLNGISDVVEVEQDQFSQEFRLTGSGKRLDWVTGLYYYSESTDETINQFFSLDIFGFATPTPINPPTNIDPYTGEAVPPKKVVSDLESLSLYGQGTYTPAILNDQLQLTFGLRYTNEEKSGRQILGGDEDYQLEDNRADPSFNVKYTINDTLNIYTSWSQAFRSGGVNVRSANLEPFDREKVDTTEVGLKYYGLDKRLRVNVALFKTNYDDMFIDVFDPLDLTINDTINAENTVKVDGAEIETTWQVTKNLTTLFSYTYLDGDFPLQPNSLSPTNELEQFNITQTPKHSGSLVLDYQFPQTGIGQFGLHTEIVSRSLYHHYPSGGVARPDGYTLFNAKLELSSIPITQDNGNLRLGIWGKNITDEEYTISSFHFEGFSTIQAFGEPRTYGVDINYEF